MYYSISFILGINETTKILNVFILFSLENLTLLLRERRNKAV